ncbi:MAG: penicillin-binding transpeptidase domain-containing protein [Oscillospiraceae bacterium]|nr:penicillin-binding transpeptidase domain-containing protein [Oscillospiraceae bacterium]
MVIIMKQLSPTPGKWMRIKLYGVVLTALLVFVAYISVNLYTIAVVKSEYYRMKANNQQLDGFVINANRGNIFDRNGRVLATSTVVWDVIVSPYDLLAKGDSPEKISRKLADLLELDYDELLEKCKDPDNRYEIIQKKVDRNVRDEINRFKAEEEIGLYSLYLVENSKRSYPNDRLASTVIGFTDYDDVGLYGVEASYDEYLQGRDGKLVMLKDGVGRTMSSEYERRFDAVDGNNVYLTIDVALQHYLEKNLDIIVNQHNVANRATGIMMEPSTGAILAMATTSGYNLNDPTELSESDEAKLEELRQNLTQDALEESASGVLSEEDQKAIDVAVQNERAKLWESQWKNKAIGELYFPGSVFKAITGASALEEKVIDINTGFYCRGSETVLGTKIGCWHHGHGQVDGLGKALTFSCNPAFMDIGARLGTERFYKYFDAFGFTQRTGIDLPGEEYPFTVDSGMSAVDLAISSFGQTNKITPLQMITAFAACVNGGYLVTPHVVDKITDSDGNVVKSNDSGIKRQVLSNETSEHMRTLLEGVVEANGGSNAYMPGFKIGGKSGTSEKTDVYSQEDLRFVASFCAFAPADNPKVIMLVVVDEPNPGGQPYYGSMVAAPVVSAVFKESFQHLEIYPQFTAEEQALQDTVVPYVAGMSQIDASMRLTAAGLETNFVGSGSKVINTIPASGSPIRKGSTVVVYMEEIESLTVAVPDVHGMTVTQANKAITDAGLNIRLTGGSIGNENATAVYMSIPPDTVVKNGTVIEVQFAVDVGHGG